MADRVKMARQPVLKGETNRRGVSIGVLVLVAVIVVAIAALFVL